MNDDPWILITITYGGEVRHSDLFPTLALCEEAKSIALTGYTIEENKRLDDEYAAGEQGRHEWRMEEHRKRGLPTNGTFWCAGIDLDDCSPTYGPKDIPPVRVRGKWIMPGYGDVKSAKCVRGVALA